MYLPVLRQADHDWRITSICNHSGIILIIIIIILIIVVVLLIVYTCCFARRRPRDDKDQRPESGSDGRHKPYPAPPPAVDEEHDIRHPITSCQLAHRRSGL